MSGATAGLLVLLLVAHFLGDFTPLSTPRMQKAKAAGRPVGPIAAHAAVHALLVGIAVLVGASPGVALLGVAMGIELVTHLAIDWTRGRLGAGRPELADPQMQAFWTILGIDQLAHGLVLIWIAFLVL
jgi:hypothetical protein